MTVSLKSVFIALVKERENFQPRINLLSMIKSKQFLKIQTMFKEGLFTSASFSQDRISEVA